MSLSESWGNTWGKRKPASEGKTLVSKVDKSTSGSGHGTDNTDFKQNQTSENNTSQTVELNMPVEQNDQKPKEGQTSGVQPEPETRDPRRNIGNPVTQFNGREVLEQRRSSAPDLNRTPVNKQCNNIKQHNSDPALSQKEAKLKLGDRLYESVMSNLTLLEGLARCLDNKHSYGSIKYWKHLAEHFEVEESKYKTFPCCPENSPTEKLLDLLKTQKAPEEFTIKELKEGLESIDRNDVIQDIFMKHKDWGSKLTDKTTVGSLFDSHPKIIGAIAVLLDVNEPGKKNWKQLADWFDVPKSDSQNFGESIQGNPTEGLLDYITKCLNPEMTVGYLQSILEDLQMREALDVLTKSKEVTKNTLLKDLWDRADADAVDNLCNILNQRYNSRVRGWRRLGHKLKIKKDVLDTLSPNEGEVISPTEALFSHLGGAKVWLTMENLIGALVSIDRKDALSLIKDYFPEGVVDEFLERKRAPPTETAL